MSQTHPVSRLVQGWDLGLGTRPWPPVGGSGCCSSGRGVTCVERTLRTASQAVRGTADTAAGPSDTLGPNTAEVNKGQRLRLMITFYTLRLVFY